MLADAAAVAARAAAAAYLRDRAAQLRPAARGRRAAQQRLATLVADAARRRLVHRLTKRWPQRLPEFVAQVCDEAVAAAAARIRRPGFDF